MPSVANATLFFNLWIWHLNSEGIDGTSDAPSCQTEEVENMNDADVVLQLQTRVLLDPPLTSKQKTQMPTSDVPVASEPISSEPASRAEAVTAAESILREGLRDAVSDLRVEWQKRLEELKEHEQKAEDRQKAIGPLMEFRSLGGAPPSMVVESMKPHAVGKDFLQMWKPPGQSASIGIVASVIGVFFALFLLRKLLIVLDLRVGKSKKEAAKRAETNASAKLAHLLGAMGFDPDVPVEDYEMKSPISDSESEPEAESAAEPTVEAWFRIGDENVGDEALAPAVVSDSQNVPDPSNLA